MKKIVMTMCLGFTLILGCGGGPDSNPPTEMAQEETAASVAAEVDLVALVENTADYVGQEILVSGTVDHVCKHGGKRLFIMAENPEQRFKIEAGDSISAFDVSLEGSDITVQGIVMEQKIDEAYLDDWEAKLTGEGEGEEAAAEDGHHIEDLEKIKSYRQQLADSEAGELSFYSLDCHSFEIIEA